MKMRTTHSSGLAFSLSVDFLEAFPLLVVDLPPNICTCTDLLACLVNQASGWEKDVNTYIKLPPLHMLARLLARDDDNQLRDLATEHPFVELRHDLLNVCFHLVVGRDFKIQFSYQLRKAKLQYS